MVWFGVEREYGVRAPDAEKFSRLYAGVARRVAHLPGLASGGFFTPVGRFYIDAGLHPEWSSIESDHPDDVLRSILAGERLLKSAAREAKIELFGINVDYGHSTWGSHSNFSCTKSRDVVYTQLIPFLASLVYLGCGGLVPHERGAVFCLSPRSASYINKPISSSSNTDRGLCHIRNEPLAAKSWRAHITSGETTRSDWCTWLRVASTALVIYAIEDGALPADSTLLCDPLAAMWTFCTDPTCKAAAPTFHRGGMTMTQVQRVYLQAVQERLNTPAMPDWAGLVCERWNKTLDMLDAEPSAVTCIDWCVKYKLFSEWARHEHGIELDGREVENAARLRQELVEIDFRFGSLNPPGIFDQLESIGLVDHAVPGVSGSVKVSDVPTRGRAGVRGREIVRLNGTMSARCEWDQILDGKGRSLHLPDPGCQTAEWRPLAACPSPRRSALEFLQAYLSDQSH